MSYNKLPKPIISISPSNGDTRIDPRINSRTVTKSDTRYFSFNDSSSPVYHMYSYSDFEKIQNAFSNDSTLNFVKFSNNVMKIYFINTPYMIIICNDGNNQYRLWVEVMGNKTYEFGFDEKYISSYEELYFEIRILKNQIQNIFIPISHQSNNNYIYNSLYEKHDVPEKVLTHEKINVPAFKPNYQSNSNPKKRYMEKQIEIQEEGEIIDNNKLSKTDFIDFTDKISNIIYANSEKFSIESISKDGYYVDIRFNGSNYVIRATLKSNAFCETKLFFDNKISSNFYYFKPKKIETLDNFEYELYHLNCLIKENLLKFLKASNINENNDILIVPNKNKNSIRIIFKDNNDKDIFINVTNIDENHNRTIKQYIYSLKIYYPILLTSKNYCKIEFNKNGVPHPIDRLNLSRAIWIKSKEELIEKIKQVKKYVHNNFLQK
jgi:hypothetical protein